MQTNFIKSLLVFLVVTAFLSACSSRAGDKAGAGAAPQVALPVDVIIAEETSLELTEIVAGSLVANRSVEIMSELSKKIAIVNFKDGSHVSAGQFLYKLDDADIHARIRQLEAELNLAKINEHRLHELLKTETIRQEEYDIAAAKLQSLQAAKEILLVELSKTTIRAPFSGTVGITKVHPGTLVSPGLPLVSLQESGNLKIQFTVAEKYLASVKPGNTIRFSTELGAEKLSATVISVESSVDETSRSITIQALALNRDGKLKAGMSAKVYLSVSAGETKGVMIPTEALIPGGNGYSVFLVKNGTATFHPVNISNRNEKEAFISSGIQPGDTVMVSNILRAAEGMAVSVVSNQ